MLDQNIPMRLIKEHMPVVGPEDSELAVVDHLEGTDIIKLAKDADGQHHYIPVTWVTAVDDKVHIDRPVDQAKQEWWTSPPAVKGQAPASAPAPAAHENSVDATRGQSLVARVQARKQELETLLAGLPPKHHDQGDIELALSSVEGLLTGDLEHVAEVVAVDMNNWLERNKHLAESAVEPPAAGNGAPAAQKKAMRTNIEPGQIKEQMPVVCSENGQFAVVDHMEGTNIIKLARDAQGKHHYIPLSWVTAVDDKVHVDRPGSQAKKEWATSPDELKS